MTPASIRLPITRDGRRVVVLVAAARPGWGREGPLLWAPTAREAAEAAGMLAKEVGR